MGRFDGQQGRMGPGWDKIRNRYARKHKTCEWVEDNLLETPACGKPLAVVDHIVPRFEGGTDEPENLMALCKAHNDRKTAEEGHRAWAAKKAALAARFDFTERHPGLL